MNSNIHVVENLSRWCPWVMQEFLLRISQGHNQNTKKFTTKRQSQQTHTHKKKSSLTKKFSSKYNTFQGGAWDSCEHFYWEFPKFTTKTQNNPQRKHSLNKPTKKILIETKVLINTQNLSRWCPRVPRAFLLRISQVHNHNTKTFDENTVSTKLH